jgi:branched-chain amino acid transport system substrate-binding protein
MKIRGGNYFAGPLKRLFYLVLFFFLLSFNLFNNTSALSQEKASQNIKIGFLIPDSNSLAAVHGADLSIKLANDAGGLNGHPFKLVIRSMEGPWGTGSKQAVDLIFNEKVWALLGSHDGRNAHLVEQTATKSTVVFISAWSGDPTLSQAFVPWFFNCVPNDYQQAEILYRDIYINGKSKKVAVVSDNTYDSDLAMKNFIRIITDANAKMPEQYNLDNYTGKINILADLVKKENPDCIVLFCQPSSSVKLIREFERRQMKNPIYGSLFILNENVLSADELNYLYNNLMVTSGNWSLSKYSSFRREFQEAYHEEPGMVASYSFDATNILIEAIRIAGSHDRERIQRALEKIDYEGVTGHIQFDEKGNRKDNLKIIMIKDGIPSVVK